MNTPNSPIDDELRDELSAHLDSVKASTDLTGPAVARAGEIRRRRRARTGVGAALAALAVAAPFVWWSVQGSPPVGVPATSSTSETTATTTAPTGAPTTSASGSSQPSTSTPATIPTGNADAPAIRVTVDPAARLVARPGLPYLLDVTLHRDGKAITFDASPPIQYFPLAGGRSLVIAPPQGEAQEALVIDGNGAVVAALAARPGDVLLAAVNDAGTLFVLYESSMQGSEPTARLRVFDESGTRLHEKQNILANIGIAGFVGKRIFIGNSTTGRSSVWDLEADSIEPYTAGIIVDVNERTGRAAIYPPSEFDEARCTTIADVTGASPLPVSRTCGMFQPKEFSVDGRHLLGIEVPSDGMLQSPSRVVDVATGRALVAFDEDRPLDIDSGFLPDGSVALNLVLAPVDGVEQNALMRCTVDGECTRLTETVAMPDFGTTMAPRYGIVRR